MGKIIDKMTVENIEHDGDPAVVCLRVDGSKLTDEEDGLFWQEFVAEGWGIVSGGLKTKEVIIYRK